MKRALFVLFLAFAPRAAADPSASSGPSAPHIEAPTHPVAPAADDARPPAPEPADRRPLYIAGGAIALALVFWWNRERARKLERDHGPTPPRQRRWRVKPDDAEPDDDSDALADAAEKDDKHE